MRDSLPRAPRTFRALRHRNYRLFFAGQLVSLIGTWMQNTAQSWLVYDLTGSKFLLGAVAALGSLPMLFFSPLGGALADRLPKRNILLVTQTVAMLLALTMAVLVFSGKIQVWHIAVIAALGGVVMAFDMPPRQAFVVEMVGKQDLMNALALNSSMFNGARIVGPALAGWLMSRFNLGLCYLLNALSFIAVIVGLRLMRLTSPSPKPRTESVWRHALSGFAYVWRNKRVRTLLFIVGVAGVFGWSYTVLLPAFARETLRIGESGFGAMISANGVGAMLGALSVATFGDRMPRERLIVGGLLWFCLMVTCFALWRHYPTVLVFLAGAGFGGITFMSTCNTVLQTSVSDEYRGRVMGVWALMFAGTSPLGNFQAGTLGEHLGVTPTVLIGASVCALAAMWVWGRGSLRT
ncbi:MAG: MFS transporter [Abditibacteriales bacterium]|nr:MFS transporter [Abditibacteriales bacterium]MDW8366446.1 MFS transporter [Abditibacteriales bacterium]